MATQCKNKAMIRTALDGDEKGLMFFVWNGEFECISVAIVKYIGGIHDLIHLRSVKYGEDWYLVTIEECDFNE
jgi:hypothetical protein